MFGSALSCFEDLMPYLSSITNPQKELYQALNNLFAHSLDDIEKKVDQIRLNINIKKVNRFFSHDLNVEKTQKEVEMLMKCYYHSLPLG